MSSRGKVLVAMSGGVDSSVASVLLHEQGYEVIGITMKTWDYTGSGGRSGKEVGCCTLDSMNDARSVALRFGFPHFIVDIREEFGDWVIDRFTGEYMAGRTPNPCVLCNTHIKWAALLRRADDLDCDFIATGHYARVSERLESDGSTRFVIARGTDANKDQSYALWGVSQEHLARTLLPLGTYTKPSIRATASEYGLDRVAAKPDSYEICFVPDNDYRRFLRDRVSDMDDRVGPGPFVTSDGTVVGRHQGFPFYTIGQRHGLGLALGYPVYVTAIDPVDNIIRVGPSEELLRHSLVAGEVNMVKYGSLAGEYSGVGMVRYNDAGAPCHYRVDEQGRLLVDFLEPRRAITPGQAVVVYEDDDLVAGGWIESVAEPSLPSSA